MTGLDLPPPLPLLLLPLAALIGWALSRALPGLLRGDALWRARARHCRYRGLLPLACLAATALLLWRAPAAAALSLASFGPNPGFTPVPSLAPSLAVTDLAVLGLEALWLWLLLALLVTDLIAYRLPDTLTGSLLVAALATALLRGADPLLPLSGMAFGSGSFLLIRWAYQALRGREGLGLGDVKLMAGIGAALGPLLLPQLVLLAAGLGLLGSVVAAATNRAAQGMAQGMAQGTALRSDQPLPFGAALCLAAVTLHLL